MYGVGTPTPRRSQTAKSHCAGASDARFSAMSITFPEREPSTLECRNPLCDATGKRWEFQGQFCSHSCEVEKEGYETLAAVKYDHRYCYTCGTRLKDITGVPPDWFWSGFQKETRQAFVGHQFLRPEATLGEVVRHDDPEIIGTGVVCNECGNTKLSERISDLWEDDPDHYADRILTVLETEYDEQLNRRAFWDWFGGDNFEYAVGKAARR